MKEITQDLLTVNEYSRSGKKIKKVMAIVIHYTANPNATAKQNRDFFEKRKEGKDGYGSAHYIVGVKGEIIQCIPDDEVAYHCGSSTVDPKSNKVYTDYAREKLGIYAIDYKMNSPNNVTLGIELCNIDEFGNFSPDTWKSGVELTASLLKKYNLTINEVTTHHQLVGWKFCPKLFVDKPEELIRFKKEVFGALSQSQ